MAKRAREAKPKGWSYSAGERGENRVRVFERPGYGIWIDYCDEAGKRHRESLATTSKARQRYERRTFLLFRKQFGVQRLVKTLSRRDCDAYIAARQSGQLRPAGVRVKRSVRNQIIRHDLTLFGMILSWACDAGDGDGGFLLERNPLKIKRKNGESGVLLPKEISAKRPVLSTTQFDAVRGAASAESSAAETFVILAWRTGHRANSIRHLRWSDVDLDGGRLHWCAEHDKVGGEHVTPMHPDVSAALQREWQIA